LLLILARGVTAMRLEEGWLVLNLENRTVILLFPLPKVMIDYKKIRELPGRLEAKEVEAMRKIIVCLCVVAMIVGMVAVVGCGEDKAEDLKGKNVGTPSVEAGQASDGTPEYSQTVEEGYRKLQYKTSIYPEVPPKGAGIRLGIYQVEAACGEGASEKNMDRLEEAVKQARQYDVQLLAFPELYDELVSPEAEFLDESTSGETDFLKGGFVYPSYEGGKEHKAE